jgi:hypothetical protein
MEVSLTDTEEDAALQIHDIRLIEIGLAKPNEILTFGEAAENRTLKTC